MTQSRIFRDRNRVVVEGHFGMEDVMRPIAGLNEAVQGTGYSDVVLDFSGCTSAFAGPMLAVCSQVMNLRLSRIDAELILPSESKLAGLFRSTNWAHFIEPRKFKLSEFRGYSHLPATQFRTGTEQQKAVNVIVNTVLGAIRDLEREELAALEWSINEITDNVLNHAQSRIGGLVQVTTFQKARKRLEYIVVDAGMGIPTTLRATHPKITSDAEALNQAIREGVTRDKTIGQGNGLFGSFQICCHSNGTFQIESGRGKLWFTEKHGLHVRTERIPFDGTLVAAQIDFSVPHLLEEALQFGGKSYKPVDYVELHYESQSDETILFKIKEESSSFGSRVAGAPVRKKLANLARMSPRQRIIIDFSGVPLVSSSFADEVLGKLFVEFGFLTFMQRFELVNVEPTVKLLIDKSVGQRVAATKTA